MEEGPPGRGDSLRSAEICCKYAADEYSFLLWAKGNQQGCERWGGNQVGPQNNVDGKGETGVPDPHLKLRLRMSRQELKEIVEWSQASPSVTLK